MTTFIIACICGLIIVINLPRIIRQKDEAESVMLYECREGTLKGIRPIKDWRKIAVDLARATKNSKLAMSAKYGTDEDVIGLLWLNFGIDLFDVPSGADNAR